MSHYYQKGLKGRLYSNQQFYKKNVKLWNNLEQCGLTVKDKGLARYCHFCNFVTELLIETFKNQRSKS